MYVEIYYFGEISLDKNEVFPARNSTHHEITKNNSMVIYCFTSSASRNAFPISINAITKLIIANPGIMAK